MVVYSVRKVYTNDGTRRAGRLFYPNHMPENLIFLL